MIARYYVYEQHMEREKSGTQAQEGYQEARASWKETRRKYRETADWMMAVYSKVGDGMEEHRMKSQNKERSIHEM